jgi:dipeptidyl-peptidase-4
VSDSFPRQHARTRRFTLGAPRDFRVGEDGARVTFLRSTAGDDPVNRLWVLDVASGEQRIVADPATLLGEGDAVPEAEAARRERARELAGGIVAYDPDATLTRATFALSGRVFLADLVQGGATELPSSGDAFDPRLDPTGRRVAYVSGATLRCTGEDGDRLVAGEGSSRSGGTDGSGGSGAGGGATDAATVSWGSAEFVAAEEMHRTRGFWWAPDGERLLVERVDVAPVAVWHIASPVDPWSAPRAVRYPAAGTANADVQLAIVGLDGSRVAVDWRRGEFEYLCDASWAPRDEITLVVQARDQRTVAVLVVDPASGDVREVARVTDPDWVELVPGAPAWADGRLVTAEDRDGARRLCVDGRAVTPDGLQVRRVFGFAGGAAYVAATTESSEVHVWRVPLDGAEPVAVTTEPGVHGAAVGADVLVLTSATVDSAGTRVRVQRGDAEVAAIESFAEAPVVRAAPSFHVLGTRALRTALLVPDTPVDGPLPVLLDPYGGPHALRVQKAQSAFLTSQWLANQGFAVLVCDGRGTPARGPEWERAVRGDFAGPVLEDQIDALHAMAERDDRLDLSRVGIRGWSFGGYLAALAVLERPDVFRAAVAGAPVTEWALYDTHYTERYLGTPQDEPDNYTRSDLTPRAGRLERPLLIIHGMADDNVVVAHTLRLSRALLEHGRPHQVVPLSGVTHMTPQETVAENLLLLEVDFFRTHLGQ